VKNDPFLVAISVSCLKKLPLQVQFYASLVVPEIAQQFKLWQTQFSPVRLPIFYQTSCKFVYKQHSFNVFKSQTLSKLREQNFRNAFKVAPLCTSK
jgi:hypothetical protein